MYFARIQDFTGEEPSVSMPENAPTCLQAVSETLGATQGRLNADSLIEGLFRRGYAVVSVASCPSTQIFKGKQV